MSLVKSSSKNVAKKEPTDMLKVLRLIGKRNYEQIKEKGIHIHIQRCSRKDLPVAILEKVGLEEEYYVFSILTPEYGMIAQGSLRDGMTFGALEKFMHEVNLDLQEEGFNKYEINSGSKLIYKNTKLLAEKK